jgi:uncharacterized damage-inducible protein DinB
MTIAIRKLFERDLIRLKNELLAYNDENSLWVINECIKNSGGNLAIHLIGNLNHFIGSVLGTTGYIRQRDKEFNDKNISREAIIKQIDDLQLTIDDTLSSLSKKDLDKSYPLKVFEKEMTTEYFLIHLYGHFNYHLGQINYHRRLLG